MDKAELRRRVRDVLRSLSPDDRDRRSRQACLRLASCPPFQQASVVMMFLSMPDEIDTAAAIGLARQKGMTVAVPRVDWTLRATTPVILESMDVAMAVGRGGVRHPASSDPVPLEQIDLVVTPGLAFDLEGHRLGRGAGFYDRFFSDPRLRAVRCGFCFLEQVVQSVPAGQSDLPVHWLVTDEQAVRVR